jgi:SOS-response transcriptional repressor LexA
MMLTPNQLKVFDFINSYIKKNRVPPTIREIARNQKCVHSNIWRILRNIEQRGYLKIYTGKYRGIEVIKNGNSIQK